MIRVMLVVLIMMLAHVRSLEIELSLLHTVVIRYHCVLPKLLLRATTVELVLGLMMI